MAGTKSRNKGQRGEREFITLLQGVVDEVFGEDVYELKRNLFQTREGGCDVSGLPPELDFISVEVKRQETLNLNSWWKQTCEQATKNQVPVLAYRQSRKKWRIRTIGLLQGGFKTVVDISLEAFLEWYKEMLRRAK